MSLPKARRVLVCLRYGIGDVVMEMPALETLRRHLPDAHITMLGACPALELLRNDPKADALANVHAWGLRHWGDLGNERIKTRFRQWISDCGFDLIIDPSHAVIALREAIWQLDAIAIVDASDPSPALMRGQRGIRAVNHAVGKGWGITVPETLHPRLHLPLDASVFTDSFLEHHGISGNRIAGISPVASSHLKQFPLDRLAAVADYLTEEMGYRILQFCGPQEAAGRVVRSRMRHPDKVVSVGPCHLGRVGALLARCSLFVGNDTGLMHMAAALNVPVIAVFGPTSPAIYLPEGNARAVTGINIDCPHRKTGAFGPSDCIVQGRCLISEAGCITKAGIEQVVSAIKECALPAPASEDSANTGGTRFFPLY